MPPRRVTPGILSGRSSAAFSRSRSAAKPAAREPPQRPRILPLDPARRLGALDLLEPKERIVIRRRDRRPHIHFRHCSARCYEASIRTQAVRHDQPPHAMIEAIVEAGGVVVALALLLYFQVLRAEQPNPPRPPDQPIDK